MAPTDGTVPNPGSDSNPVREEESTDFVVPGVPNPDALIRRRIGVHTLDKLEVLKMYDPAMTTACKRAPNVIYAEGFAGPGLNTIDGKTLPGSPIIALTTRPRFEKCIFVEKDPKTAASLAAATSSFGDRSLVFQGDCNVDLPALLRAHVTPFNPALCVLDPEGFELNYSTIVEIAEVKRRYKVEQLILFPTHMGFLRVLSKAGWLHEKTINDLTRMFGNDLWLEIYDRRIAGHITTDQATTEYVKLYAQGLRDCGYRHVLDRAITDRGHAGRIRYFLLFATDHPTGDKIMDSVFNRAITSRDETGQQTLFDIKPERRRRLDE